ncbi:pyridine nucleotide-disulfide oxidoreductase [Lentzea sp. NBRC 105346]|uniref:NAD(P)-binding domain-containing protein n=1 Tax=Lentzea sp. NBRC 105346 TaxID=3032205 RepID=UPI0024A51217|nr:NAD(P)-binding domain-containing protein [Lentzea sp. NBRC 105346]GLZ35219.1 pyridine nucleotide-disulfide oxidoreductase [Lentzea sp. NBRC 105346]
MDYLVIGAGPAGLQLGYYLEKAGRDYLVLEAADTPGAFYTTFPRHRRMISINKPNTGWTDPELNLRMDWNSLLSDDPDLLFTKYTDEYFPHADVYVRYLADFARRVRVRCGSRVTEVARPDPAGPFRVTTADGEVFEAKRVVVATGPSKPYVPSIPGVETTEFYHDVTLDADDFTAQRVLIIGKGNSAFETADHIVPKAALIHVLGPSSLKFAWRTHFIGHLRAVNNNFLDTYQLKSQNLVLDATVDRIVRTDNGYDVTLTYARRPKTVTLSYDRVITCTGFQMDASIFADSARPQRTINDRFPELTAHWESVSVPDLYFAGTLTQSRDFKKYTSAFIHGFRYGIRALHKVLEQRYEGVPWPRRSIEPDEVADALLARLNRSSALWQQYGYLSDLVVFRDGRAEHFEEIPLDLVPEFVDGSALAVSLEYGRAHKVIDPFDVDAGREWEADPAHESPYVHPVVRHYRDGELVSVTHLPEHVDNDWTDEVEHRKPIVELVAEAVK